MDKLTLPTCIMLSGPSKSGKSHLARYLVRLLAPTRFDYVFVFTSVINDDYNFLPDEFIFPNLSEDAVKKILNLQRQPGAGNCLVILDDVLSNRVLKSEVLKFFIRAYRHHKITLIITTQYIHTIDPIYREQSEYVAIFRPATARSFAALFESFGGSFENAKAMRQYLLNNTGDRKFVWYDARQGTFSVKKAPPIKPFKLNF